MTETKDVQEGEADKVDLEQLATYVAELIRGGYLIEAWGEIDRALFVYDGPVQIADSATAARHGRSPIVLTDDEVQEALRCLLEITSLHPDGEVWWPWKEEHILSDDYPILVRLHEAASRAA